MKILTCYSARCSEHRVPGCNEKSDKKSVWSLHDKAMELYDDSIAAVHNGDAVKAAELKKRASEFEAKAAAVLPEEKSSEPTRSILYRSAASMAYCAGDFEKAKRLAAKGLSGWPTKEIESELVDLLEVILKERERSMKKDKDATIKIRYDRAVSLLSSFDPDEYYGAYSYTHLLDAVLSVVTAEKERVSQESEKKTILDDLRMWSKAGVTFTKRDLIFWMIVP